MFNPMNNNFFLKLLNGTSSLLFIYSFMRTSFIFTENKITLFSSPKSENYLDGFFVACEGKFTFLTKAFPESKINFSKRSVEKLLISWRIFNFMLIPISFLCNANDYREPFLFYDHVIISLIGLNYLCFSFYPNEWIQLFYARFICFIYVVFNIFETKYRKNKNIFLIFLHFVTKKSFLTPEIPSPRMLNLIKNILVVMSSLKCIFYYQYLYQRSLCTANDVNRIILVSTAGSIVYLVRYIFLHFTIACEGKIQDYRNREYIIKLILTYLFHYCIMNILYMATESLSF